MCGVFAMKCDGVGSGCDAVKRKMSDGASVRVSGISSSDAELMQNSTQCPLMFTCPEISAHVTVKG